MMSPTVNTPIVYAKDCARTGFDDFFGGEMLDFAGT
jgi:hypothetical protein